MSMVSDNSFMEGGSGGVMVNTKGLRDIAESIRTNAGEFKAATTAIMDEMKTRLSTEPNDKAYWYGVKAALFLQEFVQKEADFNNAYNNFVNQANNLEDQASSWESYENA